MQRSPRHRCATHRVRRAVGSLVDHGGVGDHPRMTIRRRSPSTHDHGLRRPPSPQNLCGTTVFDRLWRVEMVARQHFSQKGGMGAQSVQEFHPGPPELVISLPATFAKKRASAANPRLRRNPLCANGPQLRKLLRRNAFRFALISRYAPLRARWHPRDERRDPRCTDPQTAAPGLDVSPDRPGGGDVAEQCRPRATADR